MVQKLANAKQIPSIHDPDRNASYRTQRPFYFDLIIYNKMADFVTYCRLAVVDDHDVSGCMNHQLEVETDYGAPKWTESKTNVYRQSPKLDVERRSPKLVVERRSPIVEALDLDVDVGRSIRSIRTY